MSVESQSLTGSPIGQRVLGKYVPVQRLAVGGMAEVYLAKQVGVANFERLVILKRLLPELANSADFVRQFLDEARLSATLSHPNIVSVYEVAEHEGQFCLAMELIRGVTLASLIAERPEGVPFEIAARIVREVAAGLHHAHQASDASGRPLGIVHRDISPSNVMIGPDGEVKILDFGIARAEGRLTKTQAGTIKGKWGYMPLEQLSGAAIDHRADQFALGVVFWELCAGRRLFSDENMVKLVSEREVGAPSTIQPSVPPNIDRIIQRMVENDADGRYNSCAEVVRSLDQADELAQSSNYSSDAIREHCAELVERVEAQTHRVAAQGVALSENASAAAASPGTVDLSQPVPDTSILPPRTKRRWGLVLGLVSAVAALGALSVWRSADDGGDRAAITAAPAQPAPPKEPAPVVEDAPKAAPPETVSPPRRTPKRARRRSHAAPTTGVGFLNVDTQPWSEVWVDGRFVGTTPVHKLELPVGVHRLRFVNNKRGLKKSRKIRIEKNKSLKLIEPLE